MNKFYKALVQFALVKWKQINKIKSFAFTLIAQHRIAFIEPLFIGSHLVWSDLIKYQIRPFKTKIPKRQKKIFLFIIPLFILLYLFLPPPMMTGFSSAEFPLQSLTSRRTCWSCWRWWGWGGRCRERRRSHKLNKKLLEAQLVFTLNHSVCLLGI